MSNHQDASSFGSVVIGFFLAIMNHTFGWFNMILSSTIVSEWLQALITGSIGAIGAFLMTKLLKFFEKKIKTKWTESHN